MANTIGQFDFEILEMSKSDAIPVDPIILLCLKNYSTTSDGFPTISPHLMSEVEIDEYVALLKSDLDSVARSAKAKLRKAKEKTLKLVSERSK